MKNNNEIVIRFSTDWFHLPGLPARLWRLAQQHRKTAMGLLAGLFICWHPGFLGSETLTLTTYYPAPYGGYVSILTTGGTNASPANTFLVRDVANARVGIGTNNPTNKVHINGPGNVSVDLNVNGRMQTGDGNGNGGVWLNNDASGFVGNVGGGIGFWTNGAGWNAMYIDKGSGNVGLGTTGPTEKLHVQGNIYVSGELRGPFCTTVNYALNGGGGCPGGYRIMAVYGSGVCASGGSTFLGGNLGDGNRWVQNYVSGCSGSMLCCRVRGW